MNTDKERQRLLVQELKAYEKSTPMNDEERSALRDWVRKGNSVHENTSDAHYENGRSMDFLDVYREDAEIADALAFMTYEEGSEYLRREYGIDRDDKPVPRARPGYDALLKKADRLFRICLLYRDVLASNDLLEEAGEYVAEYIDTEPLFDLFEYDIEGD